MSPLFLHVTSIKFPLDYFCYMQIFMSTLHNLHKLQHNDPIRQTIHIFDKSYVISCLYFVHIKRNDPAFSLLQHWFLRCHGHCSVLHHRSVLHHFQFQLVSQ